MIDQTLLNAISKDYTAFSAVLIDLNNGDKLALLDGSGAVAFVVDGVAQTFTGSHPIYGSLRTIGEIVAGMTNEAPTVSITIIPPTGNALGFLAQPEIQGSTVRVFEGAINRNTGAVVGQPFRTFKGFIDVPRVSGPQPAMMVEFDCAATIARLLNPMEGRRLSLTWQQRCFPGDRGLEWNVDAQEDPPWGIEGIRTGSTAFSSGGGGSGGGGGGGGVGSISLSEQVARAMMIGRL